MRTTAPARIPSHEKSKQIGELGVPLSLCRDLGAQPAYSRWMSDDDRVPPRALVIATAWWIAAELVKRHPEEITVIESHPGGGQSDCLSVYHTAGERLKSVVLMNQHCGACHLHGPGQLNWSQAIMASDRRRDVIEMYESAAGLKSPTSTPEAHRSSVAIRAIAAFMERVALAVHAPWTMENGYLDTAGYDGGVREEHFQALPAVNAYLRELPGDRGVLGFFEYRFWFLRASKESKPVLAIDQREGLAWDQHREYDLFELYTDVGRSMDRLVSAVFPPAF